MQKLWEKIKNIKTEKYCTDYYSVYNKILPKNKLEQSKAKTYTIEGKNNQIRHYLARFHRKTHCYSKNENMIEKSLLLFFNKEKALSIFS